MDNLLEQLKERRSIVDIIYDILQERIIHGELTVNGTVNQVELAKDLNVSRTVIREALRRLEAKNLINFSLNHSATTVPISPENLHDIILIRETMETTAIRRAVPQIKPDTIGQLELILSAMEQEHDVRNWHKLDRNWHMMIYRSCGNQFLCEMIMDTRVNIQRAMQYVVTQSVPRKEEAEQEHQRILQAIIDQDVDAAENELRIHIKRTEQSLIKRLTQE